MPPDGGEGTVSSTFVLTGESTPDTANPQGFKDDTPGSPYTIGMVPVF